jgi:hypothetical protein
MLSETQPQAPDISLGWFDSIEEEEILEEMEITQQDKTILFNLPNSNLQVECKLVTDCLWQIAWVNSRAGKTRVLDKTFSTSQMIAVTDYMIDASTKHGMYR